MYILSGLAFAPAADRLLLGPSFLLCSAKTPGEPPAGEFDDRLLGGAGQWDDTLGTCPRLGIAGRNAAGGCHFLQELRSGGSDKRPTTDHEGQLRLPKVFRLAQNPKLHRTAAP